MRLVSFGPRGSERPGALVNGSVLPLPPVMASLGLDPTGTIRSVLPVTSGAKFAPVNAGPIRCPMEMVQAENHLARPPW